jgi:ribosomal protein S18 acetylase RimI-like enzyme
MKCIIRTASPQDFRILTKLADELVHLENWSVRKKLIEKLLQNKCCHIFVAQLGEKVVGFLDLRVFQDFVEGSSLAVILNLVVSEKQKGRGIGSMLIERAVEVSEHLGVKEVHIWTEFDNNRAIKFYLKHGFERRVLLLEREFKEKE